MRTDWNRFLLALKGTSPMSRPMPSSGKQSQWGTRSSRTQVQPVPSWIPNREPFQEGLSLEHQIWNTGSSLKGDTQNTLSREKEPWVWGVLLLHTKEKTIKTEFYMITIKFISISILFIYKTGFYNKYYFGKKQTDHTISKVQCFEFLFTL